MKSAEFVERDMMRREMRNVDGEMRNGEGWEEERRAMS